jgi:RB1-inducible coiled-coil protein 1
MIQLDMNVALEKVEYLKGVIARTCCIPPEKQVLLISGGESLDANETVCKYSMGTDTNPIFLFSMVSIESTLPPEVPAEYNTGEAALNEKVENSFSLRDTQNTVAIRTSLAQEYVKGSTAQTRSCETLIHDQHLQHQGWLAVVANLEDLASDIQKQLARMESNYNMYLSRREEYQNLVDSFDEDLAILHQIPIFPALLKPEITESMAGSVLPDKPYKDKSGKSINLLEWINSRGSSQSLDQVADSCYRAIQQMDEELLTDLKGKVLAAVEGSGNSQMKEIRGLGDRLAGLEQLLLEAKRLVQEQQDMAQAFIQNQQRASGLQDNSILPDLCASHKQQLIVMKDNNSRVISIRSRCSKAKSELSANLHRRMKWVVFIQDQMAEVGRTLLMHAEEIRRLTRKMEVIEQIHTAPAIYMAMVLEVVRRKAFSGHYLSSTASLAETFSTLHKEEIILRTNYQAKIKKHFLSKMFPGMDDYPPPFANDCPGQFDNCLPEITLSDVEQLRQKFPDLAKSLSVPESNALSNLLARSFNQKLTPEEGETLYSLQNLPGKITIHSNDIASVSVLNRLISVEHPSSGRRKLRKHPSAAGNSSDSETDTDADINTRRQNGPSKRRDRNKKAENNLTRSLPLENSVLTLTNSYSAKNDELKVNNISSDSMEKTPENENRLTPIKDINGRNGSVGNVDHHISSSSADPSSSSGGNTSVSVAPSSSSDGSALLNSKLKVNGTGIAEEGMDKYASLMIDSLNSKVISTENMFKRLQDDVKSVCLGENGDSSLQRLRHDLMELKNQVLEDKDEYNFMIKEFSKVLASQIGHVEILSKRQTDVVLRNQSEIDTRHAKEILELEQNKLSDCHREIEIYREQLEHSTRELDCMKSDAIDEKVRCEEYVKKEVEEKDRERGEAIKKLMLEHELELETLRHELERSEKVLDYQRQVSALKSRLHENEGNIANLTEKLNNLQGIHEEKLLSEKEKIVHILEAGFVQREKLAIQQVESDLEVKFNKEMKDAVIEHQATREGEKEKIR